MTAVATGQVASLLMDAGLRAAATKAASAPRSEPARDAAGTAATQEPSLVAAGQDAAVQLQGSPGTAATNRQAVSPQGAASSADAQAGRAIRRGDPVGAARHPFAVLLRQAIAAATGKDASVQASGEAKQSPAGAAVAKAASGQTQASQDATANGLKAPTGRPAASTHQSALQTKGPRSPQAKTAPAVTSEAGSPKANEQKQSAQAGSQTRTTPGTAPEPKAAAAATHIAAHALEGARLSQEGKASRDAQRTKGRATGSAKAVAADGRPEAASAHAGRGGSAAQAKASHAAGSESARGFSVDRPQGGDVGQGQGSGPQGVGFSAVPAAQAQDGKAAGLTSAAPDQAQRGTPGQALSDQIAETVRASGARDGQQVVVSLRPPELGRVRILFRRDGDSVRGSVQVESAATLAKLQREALPLMERLQQAGVQVRRLDMTLQPPPQGDTAANPQSREGQARPDGWAAEGGGAAAQGDGAEPSAGASAATAPDGVVTDSAINVRI